MKVVHQLGIPAISKPCGDGTVEFIYSRADDINIGEIVRRMEPNFELMPCFNASDACVIEPACVLNYASPRRAMPSSPHAGGTPSPI